MGDFKCSRCGENVYNMIMITILSVLSMFLVLAYSVFNNIKLNRKLAILKLFGPNFGTTIKFGGIYYKLLA